MLDDQLTLLDGTDVATLGALAQLHGLEFWVIFDLISGSDEPLPPETVLNGVRYFSCAEVGHRVAALR